MFDTLPQSLIDMNAVNILLKLHTLISLVLSNHITLAYTAVYYDYDDAYFNFLRYLCIFYLNFVFCTYNQRMRTMIVSQPHHHPSLV